MAEEKSVWEMRNEEATRSVRKMLAWFWVVVLVGVAVIWFWPSSAHAATEYFSVNLSGDYVAPTDGWVLKLKGEADGK